MNKILFIVHTEYHLLITSKIIFDHFNNENFEVEIILSKVPGISRLKDSYDFSIFKNIHVSSVYYDVDDKKPIVSLQILVERILNSKYQMFFFFQEHDPLDLYLGYKLHKKGTIVCLGPDGAKAYNYVHKIFPRWSTFEYLKGQKFLLRNKFYFLTKKIPSIKYASNSFVDEVWLSYPEKYKNWNNKKLVKINDEYSEDLVVCLKKVFDATQLNTGKLENSIFYINQGFSTEELLTLELELLMHLDKLNFSKVYVKFHPNITDIKNTYIEKFPNFSFIDDNLPAELFILNLTNSIVISFWSTVNLTKNQNCRNYWLYPMLKNKNINIRYLNIINPTDHIIMVDNLEDIK